MAKARRDRHGSKRHNGEPVIAFGDGQPASGAPRAAAALAELRQLLAEAGAPDHLLQVLDGPGTPEEILQRLTDAGILPSPEDSLAGLIDYFEPLLERDTDALQAELAGSRFLGMVRDGTPAEDLPELLLSLTEQAEEHGGPAALAMLRVLAAMGPPQIRNDVAAAADRLAGSGPPDPAWVEDLGSPRPGRCFGYADLFGAQEAVAITFRYRRQQHALCVLIDHDLGGGVKDCWPTDQVSEVRAQYQAMADPGVLEFREYQPAEAHAILVAALGREPCPQQPDQVEDVRDYVELLRQRVNLLARAAGTAGVEVSGPADRPRRGARGRDDAGGAGAQRVTVHRLKIGLRGAKPPIWRRLEVPSRFTLDDLHHTVQEAFDWHNCHLWAFETPYGEYGSPDPELGHRSADSIRLERAAPQSGDRIRYTYDFGDDWVHDIQVEQVLDAEPGVAYPRCLAGRRASPPEDCGGVWGYRGLLEILDDPDHPEHADRLGWLGLDSAGQLDPAAFDRDELNRDLSAQVLVPA